eukprot:gb/GEZJ01005002.1/.p1 GENE.gb/GEZJ01005002.1/~~gb/GEZJ01005002.1/.p1  ORF type:complete len:167 (-),score=23.05 gb/GEZJ01005002.1/:618-1118(-)
MKFKKAHADSGILKGNIENHHVFLALYFDDLVIASDSVKVLELVKNELSSNFRMKDLGKRYVLGIEVDCNMENGSMKFCQKSFTETDLSRFNTASCKAINTSMEVNMILSETESENCNTEVPCCVSECFKGQEVEEESGHEYGEDQEACSMEVGTRETELEGDEKE